MATRKMHIDEVETNHSLVGRLLTTQFPQWADLPIKPVPSAGTDNALYRLGDDKVVRLPRIHWAVGQIEKEQRWLPKLAPHLPLAIPTPLAHGQPGEAYPWNWSVYRWLEGENADLNRTVDPHETAADLAGFILAMQGIDARDGPSPGQQNSSRGVPLALRDEATRSAIAALDGMDEIEIDIDAVTAAWDAALHVPAWAGLPVWIHGDLHSGNLLALRGRLSAVIDFGCLGVGDPACDVMAAWLYLPAETRELFRSLLQVDDATWARGRGWALSMGLIALPYYHRTNPMLAAIARRAIDEVLTEHYQDR